MVIDDDDVRFGGALTHQRDEAVAVARTLGPEAGVRFGGELAPGGEIVGQFAQSGAVAVGRGLQPLVDDRDSIRSPLSISRPAADVPPSTPSLNMSHRCRHR